MKVAVLFDGAGLARLGLERAGHECTGFELNPLKVYLGRMVGSGNVHQADARDVDLSSFDAVWTSSPCQTRSSSRNRNGELARPTLSEDLLPWCLALDAKHPDKITWHENVRPQNPALREWGVSYNAAQFEAVPRQLRQRLIGGRHPAPQVHRPFKTRYPGLTGASRPGSARTPHERATSEICYAITATEWRGCASDKRRASRWYGRRLTHDECAWHQGFEIPDGWRTPPLDPRLWKGGRVRRDGVTDRGWWELLYEAIGNGVPVEMAKAFGDAASKLALD